jgi:hypothetical protein
MSGFPVPPVLTPTQSQQINALGVGIAAPATAGTERILTSLGVGIAAPAATGAISTTNSTLDDGSGNLTTGGTLQAGGAGASISNTGLITVLGAGGGVNTAAGAAVAAQSFVSGTAAQLSQTAKNAMLITTVTLGGTLTLAIGPTAGVANTIIATAAVSTGEVLSCFIPAGWFVKYTLVTATIASQAITM